MSALRRRVTVQVALIAALACAASAGAQPSSAVPPGAAPQLQQVELSEDSAKRAIDTYLTLRDKYGDKIPAPGKAQALQQGMSTAGEVNTIITGNGFADTGDWHKTLTSVALAYGFVKEGKEADMDAKIAEMKANTQLPENIKTQMVQMMTALRPSENNMKVVKGLAADPAYDAKLAQVAK